MRWFRSCAVVLLFGALASSVAAEGTYAELIELARTESRLGRWEKAEDHLKAARRHLEEGDTLQRARWGLSMSAVVSAQGRYPDAVDHLEEALRVLVVLDPRNPLIETEVLYRLTGASLRSERLARALEYGERAVSACAGMEDPEGARTASCRLEYGTALRAAGRREEATKEFRRALRIFAREGHRDWAARCYVELGYDLSITEPVGARKYLDQAVKLFEAEGLKGYPWHRYAEYAVARLDCLGGRYRKAEDRLVPLLPKPEKHPDWIDRRVCSALLSLRLECGRVSDLAPILEALDRLAPVTARLGRHRLAVLEERWEEAAAGWEVLKDEKGPEYSSIRLFLADARLRVGEPREAVKILSEEANRSIGQPGIRRAILAGSWLALGQLEEAETEAKKALAEMKTELPQQTLWYARAQICLGCVLAKKKEPDAALEKFQAARIRVSRTGAECPALMGDTWLGQARVERSKGKHDAALESYGTCLRYRERAPTVERSVRRAVLLELASYTEERGNIAEAKELRTRAEAL